MKQLGLFNTKTRLEHGGEPALGRRKEMRPLSSKKPLHLILKAKRLLLPKRHQIPGEVRRFAIRFGLTVYEIAIAPDHLHFALRIPSRDAYKKFVRALSSSLARLLGKDLWLLSPFTRVAHWGRDFRNLLAYLKKNREETNLQRAYEPRKRAPARVKASYPDGLFSWNSS